MMVDDLQDFCLFQAQYRLGLLVVVHQYHPLAAGLQQMETGQGTHHPFLLIQNGIGPEAAFQDGIPHVVDIVVQMEADQVLVLADAADGQRVIQQTYRPVSVIGSGDDTGGAVPGPQLRVDFGLTDDDADHAQLHCPPDHVRLVTADHDAVGVGEHQILPAGGQGDGDLAGDHVPKLLSLVEDLALQHRQQVENRHLPQPGIADGRHIVACHVSGGQHTEQRPILVGHRDDKDLVLLHGLPGPADGGGGGQRGRRVVVQIPDLGADVGQQTRRLKAEPVQNDLGLVTDLAQPGGLILPLAQGVFQCGVRHGGDNGIRVGIPVSGNINGIHERLPFAG